jgi:hypothetical protein
MASPYRSTLDALIPALSGGLDPMMGYQLLQDAQNARMERRTYLDQLREEEEAEREARRVQRQQTFGALGGQLFESAAGGMPLPAAQSQLDFLLEATPGVGPRMEGRLEGLLKQAYPRQQIPMGPDMLTAAREGGAGQAPAAPISRPGPRMQQSPMFVPPPVEPSAMPELPDLAGIDVPVTGPAGFAQIDPNTGKPMESTLGRSVAQKATEAASAGVPQEEAVGLIAQALLQDGYGPEVIASAQQQVAMIYATTPPVPTTPRPQARPGQQAGGGGVGTQATASYPRGGMQITGEGDTWVAKLMDLLGFM